MQNIQIKTQIYQLCNIDFIFSLNYAHIIIKLNDRLHKLEVFMADFLKFSNNLQQENNVAQNNHFKY